MRRARRTRRGGTLHVVLDASAAVELLLPTTVGAEVERALEGTTTSVPAHFDAEVLSTLARLVRTGRLDPEVAPLVLRDLESASIARWPLPPLLAAAWRLRANVSPPDALYVALAVRLGATLLTADRRLARAPGLPVGTIVVGA